MWRLASIRLRRSAKNTKTMSGTSKEIEVIARPRKVWPAQLFCGQCPI
jgi:hypothetical protein